MKVKVNTTEVERTYSIGQHFIRDGREYMLAQVGFNKAHLVSLNTGLEILDAVTISNVDKITKKEFDMMYCKTLGEPVPIDEPKETNVEFKSLTITLESKEEVEQMYARLCKNDEIGDGEVLRISGAKFSKAMDECMHSKLNRVLIDEGIKERNGKFKW